MRKVGRKQCISVIFASCLIGSSTYQAVATPRLTQTESTQVASIQVASTGDTPIKTEPTEISNTAVGDAAVGEETLASVRSRLVDLEQLPLFLSGERGTLESADNQLSTTQLSRPSFAWIRDQVAVRYESVVLPTEIVSQWQAYTTHEGFKYIDVIVNEAQWEQLNYLRRYGFVIQFGTVARNAGYQLRIFHTGDARNRNDALSLTTNSGTTVVGRSIRLRGAYFCTANTANTEEQFTCNTFIAP